MSTRRLRVLLTVLAVALVAGLGVAGWRWREISVYPEAGGWGMGARTWKIGKPIYIGMSYEKDDAHGTITITSVRPDVVHDSADAHIGFYVCTVNTAETGAIGSSDERDMRRFCSSLVPADGARLKLNAHPFQQVVMAVTLTRPGRVKIAGMRISYARGWHRGSDLTGGIIVVGGPTRNYG